LNAANQQEVDRYWATEMGVVSPLQPAGSVVCCTIQNIYSGVQLLIRNERLLVACPPNRAGFVTAHVKDLPPDKVFSVEFIKGLLTPKVERVIGPAHLAYADGSTFRPSRSTSCRMLTPGDTEILQEFAATLSQAEVEQSGFNTSDVPAFGAFADGVLCAAASYQIWETRIAHIIVATRPTHRRRGHARAAVTALAEHALARNLVLQWRALASNEHSSKLAESLGFQPYGSTIYARLESA
jgi:GNAT superfamily N-acetyltransferase